MPAKAKATEVKLAKPAPRTKVEIEREYANICSRLGHCTYQIGVLGKDADLMQSTLRDLNLEAAAVAKLEAEATAAANTKESGAI